MNCQWAAARPLLGSTPRLVNAVIGGLDVSGIANYFSGTPLGPFTAPTPLSGGWNGGNNRPMVAAGADLLNASFDASQFELSNTSSAKDTFLNKAAFSAPGTLPLGTSAKRYTNIRSFPTLNEDMALAKSNKITEKVRFSLRVEAFQRFQPAQAGRNLHQLQQREFRPGDQRVGEPADAG